MAIVFRTPIIEDVPTKTKPEVDSDTLIATSTNQDEDAYMYVHCHFENKWQDMLIRVWKTTYLIDTTSEARSKLVHAENISYAPQWTLVPDGASYTFLLIFVALPKTCKLFDLLEDIPQAGGFHIRNIARNDTDVYHVTLF